VTAAPAIALDPMPAARFPRIAGPGARWRISGRVCRLDRAAIGRFYAGRSTLMDKLRILTGKTVMPIVRIARALGAADA